MQLCPRHPLGTRDPRLARPFFFFICVSTVLGIEPRASGVPSPGSTPELCPAPGQSVPGQPQVRALLPSLRPSLLFFLFVTVRHVCSGNTRKRERGRPQQPPPAAGLLSGAAPRVSSGQSALFYGAAVLLHLLVHGSLSCFPLITNGERFPREPAFCSTPRDSPWQCWGAPHRLSTDPGTLRCRREERAQGPEGGGWLGVSSWVCGLPRWPPRWPPTEGCWCRTGDPPRLPHVLLPAPFISKWICDRVWVTQASTGSSKPLWGCWPHPEEVSACRFPGSCPGGVAGGRRARPSAEAWLPALRDQEPPLPFHRGGAEALEVGSPPAPPPCPQDRSRSSCLPGSLFHDLSLCTRPRAEPRGLVPGVRPPSSPRPLSSLAARGAVGAFEGTRAGAPADQRWESPGRALGHSHQELLVSPWVDDLQGVWTRTCNASRHQAGKARLRRLGRPVAWLRVC